MTRSLRLNVLAPDGPLVHDEHVSWIQARLADGATIGIWPGHAPLLAETVAGLVRYLVRYSDGEVEHSLLLRAGLLHIDSTSATVLVPGAVESTGETVSYPDAPNLATAQSSGVTR